MGSRSKKYPFLTNFPEYDGELENHRYDDTYGILQYIIMDYKCEESLKTKYCAKLTNSPDSWTKTVMGFIKRQPQNTN